MTRRLTIAKAAPHSRIGMPIERARLIEMRADGVLVIEIVGIPGCLACDVLHSGTAPRFEIGDEVLVHMPATHSDRPVVLGRIGPYCPPGPQDHVTLHATESLTLKCGEASVNLRADGQVMVKGEDVLLRAKGTQRIRAGNVAIN